MNFNARICLRLMYIFLANLESILIKIRTNFFAYYTTLSNIDCRARKPQKQVQDISFIEDIKFSSANDNLK